MSTSELTYLDSLIAEAKDKEAEKNALDDEVNALKSLIRDYMTDAAINELTTPNYHVTYGQCERTTVDKKKLQTQFPDVFGKTVKISTYMMLRIN